MNATSRGISRRQRASASAIALVCFGGFFLVGRTITSDDPVDPSTSKPSLGVGDRLPPPTRLALAERTPNLIVQKPRTEKPTNRAPGSSAPLAPAAPPTEQAPGPPTPVGTGVPPPVTPDPPPEVEPAPEPDPPPTPEPDPEPKPEPEPEEESVAFESSG